MKKYNHAFTVAFAVNSDNEGGYVTQNELMEALLNRLNDLVDNDELEEACGLPFDTYENETEEPKESPWPWCDHCQSYHQPNNHAKFFNGY